MLRSSRCGRSNHRRPDLRSRDPLLAVGREKELAAEGSERCNVADPEGGEEGHGMWEASRSSKNMDSPLEPPERNVASTAP